MVYGVLMILVVYFLPEGIVPAVRNWWQRPRQARGGRAAGRAPGRGGRAMNARAGIELAVDGLTIRFGGLTAVDGATFEVRAGEVLSLIGPNGAGKTTAFNAITGYIEPTGGHIAYRGQRLDGLKPNQIAALGVVRTFQKTSVFTGRSVHDNVAIGLHLRSRQTPLAILLGLPSVAREEKELATEASRDPALRRPRGARRPAGLVAALRRAAAARGRRRARRPAEAAAARRAGVGHEPGRDRRAS